MISPQLKNIQELPPQARPLAADFAHKLLEALGDRIECLAVYGSAAGANYHHGTSNINLAVIVKDLDFLVLKQAVGLVQRAHKQKMATPLFLTRDYILNSLDVFPIEYSEIKQNHKVIFGEDVFGGLDIPVKDIRLLCEQQVKGKLLNLRQVYLSIGNQPAALKQVLVATLNDLVPVFRQLIVLKGDVPAGEKAEVLKQLASKFALEPAPFLALYHDKRQSMIIASHQVEAHLQNFLNQLEHLARQVGSL